MIVYILTGLVVFLSLKNYESVKTFDYKSDKRLMVFYKFFAILTLTLIFGLRDYSVGTDTRSYLSIFDEKWSKENCKEIEERNDRYQN